MERNVDRIQIEKDAKAAWSMDDEEIYRLIGLVKMGTESVMEAKKSIGFVMSVAGNNDTDVAIALTNSTFLEKGKRHFRELWDGLKKIVCEIYARNLKLEGKDLVTYIVAAIMATVNIANALLVLIITIAVKKGLDKLCAVLILTSRCSLPGAPITVLSTVMTKRRAMVTKSKQSNRAAKASPKKAMKSATAKKPASMRTPALEAVMLAGSAQGSAPSGSGGGNTHRHAPALVSPSPRARRRSMLTRQSSAPSWTQGRTRL